MKDAAFMSIVPKQEDAKTKIVYMGERLKRNKMGMPIDDAIETLKDINTYGTADIAKRVAIDTMLKYQRICKILDKSDNGEQCMYDTIQEIEEVRDGNNN